MPDRYDVIIVGTGAGGGTLAWALASTGRRILILERGDYLPRERENWDAGAVFGDGRYLTRERWYDRRGKPFQPEMNYYVGGQTKVYGAALVRLRREDFGEVRHFDGVSPAWPLAYDDLEPYYSEAERLYRVHGERGVDPTDPPASESYPFPPLPHEPRIQEVYDDLRADGLHPAPLPMAVGALGSEGGSAPSIRCEGCDGFPCLIDHKGDAQLICVDAAVREPDVTLRVNTRVTKVVTSSSGREVTRVVAETDGGAQEFSADVVVVACGAIHSAALLLGSANDRHPNGLANSSGRVGRHLMLHNNSAMLAVSTKPNPTRLQKTLALNDFYFRAPDWEYPLGHIQLLGKSKWQMLRPDAPFFVPAAILKYLAGHSVDWWLTTEDLPDPDNRVRLDRAGRIVLEYRPNNLEPHRRLVRTLKQVLRRAGHGRTLYPLKAYFSKRLPLAAVCHQVGTCRLGRDPKTSVLDLNCRAHDLDNLYVVDGSFFPSISSVNPSLTIMANALRVADHLCERLGARRSPAAR